MGDNATLLVNCDALPQIEQDREFGRKVADAVREFDSSFGMIRKKGVDIVCGDHANAAQVVVLQPAKTTWIITVGSNLGLKHAGICLSHEKTPEFQVRLLRIWARKLGFGLVSPSPANEKPDRLELCQPTGILSNDEVDPPYPNAYP